MVLNRVNTVIEMSGRQDGMSKNLKKLGLYRRRRRTRWPKVDMVAYMKVDMVANMKVDKVADMKVDLVVGKVADMKVDMVAGMVPNQS